MDWRSEAIFYYIYELAAISFFGGAILEFVKGSLPGTAVMLLLWYFAQRNAGSKGYAVANSLNIDPDTREALYTIVEISDVLYIIGYLFAMPLGLVTSFDKAFILKLSLVVEFTQLALVYILLILAAKPHLLRRIKQR